MKFNPVLFAKAISDETRQKIMNLCCCESISVNEIVEQMDVSIHFNDQPCAPSQASPKSDDE